MADPEDNTAEQGKERIETADGSLPGDHARSHASSSGWMLAFLDFDAEQRASSARNSAGWRDLSGRVVEDFQDSGTQCAALSALAKTRAEVESLERKLREEQNQAPKTVEDPETVEHVRAELEKVNRQLETKLGEIQPGSEKSAPALQGGQKQEDLPRKSLSKLELAPLKVSMHDLQVKGRQVQPEQSWEDADCVPALVAFAERKFAKKSPGLGKWLGHQTPTNADSPHTPMMNASHAGSTNGGDGIRFRRKTNVVNSPVRSELTQQDHTQQMQESSFEEELYQHPYPYTDAVHIYQEDVTEDGLPPIPRAAGSQQGLEAIMIVKGAVSVPYVGRCEPSHFPDRVRRNGLPSPKVIRANGTGNISPLVSISSQDNSPYWQQESTPVSPLARRHSISSKIEDRSLDSPVLSRTRSGDAQTVINNKGTLFALEVVCCGQSCITDPKRGNPWLGCLWMEHFNIQIPERLIRLSRRARQDDKIGPVVTVKLHDSGLYSGQDVLGVGEIPIKQLLCLGSKACTNIECLLEDAVSGAPLRGADGQQTAIQFSFHRLHMDTWQIPSLEDTLRACDYDKIVLRPARMTHRQLINSNPKHKAGMISTLPSFLSVDQVKKDKKASLAKSGSDKKKHSQQDVEAIEDEDKDNSPRIRHAKDELLDRGSMTTGSWQMLTPIDDLSDHNKKNVHYYWKERLEEVMDSLTVNLIVIILVTIDLSTILFFLVGMPGSAVPSEEALDQLSDEVMQDQLEQEIVVHTNTHIETPPTDDPTWTEPTWMFALSLTVVCCLFIELTLRQIGQGNRFWKNRWNLFDTGVIWLSIIAIGIRRSVDAANTPGVHSVVVLRVISRIAIGLRVMRVLINLRRLRQLVRHLKTKLRSIVSQNKRRFVKHGFDLDLTYITNRVIAMSSPCFGQLSTYRNDIHVVSRFLATRHYGSFFVFNLCDTFYSSDGATGNYNPCMIFNQVQRIPFEDHGPPLMVELLSFCEEVQLWMMKDARNVIVIHCKGGKGRTGVCVASVLLWTGHRRNAIDALELFTFRRTKNYDPDLGMDGTYKHYFNTKPCNQTVEGPSQIRYVHYLEAMLYSGIDGISDSPIGLSHITVPNDVMLKDKPWYMSFTIRCCRYPIFDSLNGQGKNVHLLGGSRERTVCKWPVSTSIWGDVRIDFYRHEKYDKSSKRKLCFFVIFNTSFYVGRPSLALNKSRLDMLGKDTENKLVSANFSISIDFDEIASEQHRIRAVASEARLWNLVRMFGTPVKYEKGDVIVAENSETRCLAFIDSGSVESVCHDVHVNQYMHPLGRSTCQAASSGQNNERVPAIAMFGSQSVVGISPFFSEGPTMCIRARCTIKCFELARKSASEGSSEASKLDRRPSGSRSTSSSYSHGARVTMFLENENLQQIGMEGCPDCVLYDFYRGLSVMLGRQLSRIQMETIRIGNLKNLNDEQSILADQDRVEMLRTSVINTFGLPMNEKLLTSAKCHFKRLPLRSHSQNPLERGPKLRMREFQNRRMRLIILSNNLILDPAFYGPEISARSTNFQARQLHSVSPHESRSSNHKRPRHAIDLRVMIDNDATVATYVITFTDYDAYRECYDIISQACKHGETLRAQERIRPFESTCMAGLLEKCAIVHRLKKDERLVEASVNTSLFLICSGECRLLSGDGRVFTVLREGSCIGEVNFALECSAGHYDCIANVNSTLLEIPHGRLHNALEQDDELSAKFYYVLCHSMEIQIRTLMTHTFPGTWSSSGWHGPKKKDQSQGRAEPKFTRGHSLMSTPSASVNGEAPPMSFSSKILNRITTRELSKLPIVFPTMRNLTDKITALTSPKNNSQADKKASEPAQEKTPPRLTPAVFSKVPSFGALGMKTSSAAQSSPELRSGRVQIKRSLSQGLEQTKDEDKGSVFSEPPRSAASFSPGGPGGRKLHKHQSNPLS